MFFFLFLKIKWSPSIISHYSKQSKQTEIGKKNENEKKKNEICPCAFDTLEQGAQITVSNVEAIFDLNQKCKREI